MRVNNDYVAGDTVIKHVDELLMLMSAMIKDDRFEETINELSRKESVTMCEVLDKVEARGRKEGVISVLISLVKDDILSISEAAKRADMSEDRINNNFIKKGIKSYLIRDIIFYIQLCYNKHTKLKEVAL